MLGFCFWIETISVKGFVKTVPLQSQRQLQRLTSQFHFWAAGNTEEGGD